MGNISIERLKELFSLNEAGKLIRISTRKGRKLDGTIGNIRSDGYVRVTIDYKSYFVHRITWAIANGYWPAEQIDHINGDRSDNRLVNLRQATNSQNQANRKACRTNKLGVKGVYKTPYGKYAAMIEKSGVAIWCGSHNSIEEATLAHKAKSFEIFGEFARS